MTRSARYGKYNPDEPVLHELPPLRYGAGSVPLRIAVRRTDDGTWRARLLFGEGEPEVLPITAEIFCAPNESDLWHAVRDLPEYHLCDIYRSLTE